jgi:argininosuccinate synthase
MEVVEDEAFSPLDRIGQLSLRNLDIEDSRNKLQQFAAKGVLPSSDTMKKLISDKN